MLDGAGAEVAVVELPRRIRLLEADRGRAWGLEISPGANPTSRVTRWRIVPAPGP